MPNFSVSDVYMFIYFVDMFEMGAVQRTKWKPHTHTHKHIQCVWMLLFEHFRKE